MGPRGPTGPAGIGPVGATGPSLLSDPPLSSAALENPSESFSRLLDTVSCRAKTLKERVDADHSRQSGQVRDVYDRLRQSLGSVDLTYCLQLALEQGTVSVSFFCPSLGQLMARIQASLNYKRLYTVIAHHLMTSTDDQLCQCGRRPVQTVALRQSCDKKVHFTNGIKPDYDDCIRWRWIESRQHQYNDQFFVTVPQVFLANTVVSRRHVNDEDDEDVFMMPSTYGGLRHLLEAQVMAATGMAPELVDMLLTKFLRMPVDPFEAISNFPAVPDWPEGYISNATKRPHWASRVS